MSNYQDLENLATKKLENMQQILNLTRLQAEAISKMDDERLNSLINQKQEVIDGIDQLDKSFIEKLEGIKNEYGIKSLDELSGEKAIPFKGIKSTINEINLVISEIFSLEQENSVKLKQEYADIKDKMKEISGGKKIMNAYQGYNKPTSGGAFYDNKK